MSNNAPSSPSHASVAPTSSPALAAAASIPAGLLDLESELTCSICTEVLYQPLTLLDCLHTFCGSCLKEWFGSLAARGTGTGGAVAYTCPSCRAAVRETRPNATVTTLLDMYLRANPAKAKSAAEKEEIARGYRPGDGVMAPPAGGSQGRRMDDEEERRVLEEVRQLSLGEAGVNAGQRRGERRRDRERDRSGQRGGAGQTAEQRLPAEAARNGRPLGHQSSLRSLLNSTDLNSQEMREEILRQIMEDGLLDGIDLSNIDVTTEDEISERIAQAIRRRQRGQRQEDVGRRRELARGREEPSQEQGMRVESEQMSGAARARPPVSRPHLFEPADQTRHHRRSSSHGSSTPARREEPRRSSNELSRSAGRSATDLSERPVSREAREARTQSSQERRSTDPPQGRISDQWRRAGGAGNGGERRTPTEATASQTSIATSSSTHTQPRSQPIDTTVVQPPRQTPQPPQIQPAPPSIACASCKKQKIGFELHYACTKCADGTGPYYLCLRCYRQGVGCKHWYGFGYAAWARYEQLAPVEGYPAGHEPPHVMTAERFCRTGGGGGSTTTSRPGGSPVPPAEVDALRGAFCAVCLSHANPCYWRCDVCNDGEWGFCNGCVNQGRHCTHPLLALAYEPLPLPSPDAAASFTPHRIPLRTTCNACRLPIHPSHTRFHCPRCNAGDYDICHGCYAALAATGRVAPRDGPSGWRRCPEARHRMLLVGFEERGDGRRRVLREGLVGGWALTDEQVDAALREEADVEAEAEQQRRRGGAGADETPAAAPSWKWRDPSAGAWKSKERGLHHDVLLQQQGEQPPNLPPAGGAGMQVQAVFAYVPDEGESDELAFPRWAELREVVDINGDWYWGVYCAQGGLFPGGFGRVVG